MKARLYLALVLAPFALMCSSATQDNNGAGGAAATTVGGSTTMTPAAGGTAGSTTTAMGTSGGTATGGTATTTTGGEPATGGMMGLAGGSGGASGGAPAMGGGTGGVTQTAGTGGGTAVGGGGGSGGGGNGVQGLGPTAGCQAPAPTDAEQTWLEHDIMVANLPPDQVAESGMRRYWVRLPLTYDHTRAYPIVFYGPGCGASGVEGTPMMDTIKNDAIHVFLIGTGSCFNTGGYPTPEVPYFNQVLDEVQAKYCTDASKVFVSGYSSGGWLSHDLACGIGDRIRGIGSAAGGLTKSITDGYDCASKPKVAGILYTGENDNTNPANSIDPATGFNKGVAGARDRLILANGCDMNAMEPWPNTLGVDYCQMWKTGCEDNPVVYCVGPGDGHGNGGIISQKGWWEFWMSLP